MLFFYQSDQKHFLLLLVVTWRFKSWTLINVNEQHGLVFFSRPREKQKTLAKRVLLWKFLLSLNRQPNSFDFCEEDFFSLVHARRPDKPLATKTGSTIQWISSSQTLTANLKNQSWAWRSSGIIELAMRQTNKQSPHVAASRLSPKRLLLIFIVFYCCSPIVFASCSLFLGDSDIPSCHKCSIKSADKLQLRLRSFL